MLIIDNVEESRKGGVLMDFKSMIIRCIQEDCKKLSDLKNICGVFDRYSKMSDVELKKTYENYFGLDSVEDEILCS